MSVTKTYARAAYSRQPLPCATGWVRSPGRPAAPAIMMPMPAPIVRKLPAVLGLALLGALLAAGTLTAVAESPSPAASPEASGAPGGQTALPGDPQRGQQVYNSAGCTTCHGASLEGGVGPRLNPLQKITGVPDFKKVDEPQVVQYLIDTITSGKAPSDGYGQMPAKGGKESLTDQDIRDIAAYIVKSNQEGKPPLGPVELARSNVFWVTFGIAVMVILTYLLSRYNMRWVARRAARRAGRET